MFVLFCSRNNGYAISTPTSDQYRGDGIGKFFSSQTQNIPVHVEHRVMFFNTYGRVQDWPCHRLVMQKILSELSITHSRNRITEFYLKKWTRIIIKEDRITFPSTVCILQSLINSYQFVNLWCTYLSDALLQNVRVYREMSDESFVKCLVLSDSFPGQWIWHADHQSRR